MDGSSRSVIGLKLQKRALEQQLADVQRKVQSFQQSKCRTKPSASPQQEHRLVGTRTTMKLSLSFPELGSNQLTRPAKTLFLDELNNQQLKYRKKYGSVPRNRDLSAKQISAASGVKTSKVSKQLHQRNTELSDTKEEQSEKRGKAARNYCS